MTTSRVSRLFATLLITLLLVARTGAQSVAPKDDAASETSAPITATDGARPLTRAISVRLEKPSIVAGEPIELVLVMNGKQSYRDKWPDFLGGRAHLKVRLIDSKGKKSPFFWIDNGSMYGALNPRDIKEPIPLIRALRVQKEDTFEIHLWLGPEQLPLAGAGDYQLVVVSSRGANPTPPWYGPEGKRTFQRNVYVGLPKQEPLEEREPTKQKEAETEDDASSTAPPAPTVAFTLSVKDDPKELTKVAEALRKKITNDGMLGVSRHEAEIQALFSLEGPQALRVQEGLMDQIGEDPWGGGPVYIVMSRIGGPRIINFIADQHWIKGRKTGVNALLVMHYFGMPEARKQIEEIFRKHNEPMRVPLWRW